MLFGVYAATAIHLFFLSVVSFLMDDLVQSPFFQRSKGFIFHSTKEWRSTIRNPTFSPPIPQEKEGQQIQHHGPSNSTTLREHFPTNTFASFSRIGHSFLMLTQHWQKKTAWTLNLSASTRSRRAAGSIPSFIKVFWEVRTDWSKSF